MKTIDIYSVVVEPGRQREAFDEKAAEDLRSSISSVGLLQAPVLEHLGDQYILRAGERRLRAMLDLCDIGEQIRYDGQTLPEATIPYTSWEELTELQRLEIEVDENRQRVNFTWQEQAKATAKLARLRTMQAEETGAPAPKASTLAKELKGRSDGAFQADVRNDLVVAKYLESPEIAGAKSRKEAMNLLKKAEQVRKHRELAESVGVTAMDGRYNCYHAESGAWCAAQPAAQFDLILTDPIYGIGADTFGATEEGRVGAHTYDDSPEALRKILGWFPSETFRLAKEQAHLYAFCDIDWFGEWKRVLAAAGWRVFRTPLIWVKPGGFRLPWIECGPQRKYETLVYAVKGDKPTNFIAPDVITLSGVLEATGHPAAKPVALYSELIKRSCSPGNRILDLFAGSGPLLRAAHDNKCLATLVEQDKTFYGICVEQRNNILEGAKNGK